MKLSHRSPSSSGPPGATGVLLTCLLLLFGAAAGAARAQTTPSAPNNRDHLVAPTPALPSPTTPRTPDDCDQLQDKGERLACKAEKVQGGVDQTVDQLTADDVVLLTPEQKTSLRHQRDRSGLERERTGVSGHKKLSQRRDSPCVTVEYDAAPGQVDPLDNGNGDGICDAGELCAEVTTDGIGDEDGRCELLKEKGNRKIWEPCVQSCRPSADRDEDTDFDDDMANEAAVAFDDTSVLLGDLNAEIGAARLARAVSAAPATAADAEDKCANLLVNNRDFGEVAIQLALATAGALQTTADVCADASRQSDGGFNWAAACIAPVALAGIVRGAHNVFELHDDAVTGDRLDAVAACLEQMSTKMDANRAAIDGLGARLTEARQRLEGKADQALLLLNTPPGQRPGYPARGTAGPSSPPATSLGTPRPAGAASGAKVKNVRAKGGAR